MSSFASLLAQSKAQTQARNAEVQSTLAQRQEREQREQEERERKHRDELARQAKQRQAQAEAQKREVERAKQRELEQQAKEQERERKKRAEMDKLLGKKREEREKEPNGGSGGRSGSGSPRKKRSRSNSPSGGGGGGGPVLTRMERRALKTDPNARPAWASSLVGERGPRSGSPPPHPKHTSGIRTKKSSQSSGMKNANGYGEAIKLSRKETGSVADYLEEKRQREKSKSYLNINGGGGSSSRAVSTGPLPNKAKTNGLKPKSAPSSVAGHKRRRSDEEDEDSMFDSDHLDDDDDVPPSKRRAVGGSVLARFGLQINQREYHDYDDDDLSDMEAGYDEVERENERAYVVLFPSRPARGCQGTDDNFWCQFTGSKAGRPDRSGRRNAARRGETEAEGGKDYCYWSCLSMFYRLASYYPYILLNTNNTCLILRLLVVPPPLLSLLCLLWIILRVYLVRDNIAASRTDSASTPH